MENVEQKEKLIEYKIPIKLRPRIINGTTYWLAPKDYVKQGIVPQDEEIDALLIIRK